MSSPSTHELLAAIRALPLEERLQLIRTAAMEAEEDSPIPAVAAESSAPSLIGLMADEPDLVDHVCSLAYQARDASRMRIMDD